MNIVTMDLKAVKLPRLRISYSTKSQIRQRYHPGITCR